MQATISIYSDKACATQSSMEQPSFLAISISLEFILLLMLTEVLFIKFSLTYLMYYY